MGSVVRESIEGIGISKLPKNLGSPAFFTEVAIPEIVKIPSAKPDIEQLLSVMVEAKIVSLRIIDTPEGTSYEGQKLTGKKLSIELLLKQKVKYIADEPTQSVHAAHFEHTVSSIWIIVPKEINGKPIETLLTQGKLVVTPYIEDIYGEQLDKRTIFKNITVLVHVNTPCICNEAHLDLFKTSDKKFVKVGDRLTYTIVVSNSGSVKATNVVLKDAIAPNTVFADHVYVDNTSVAGADPTTTGVSLGDINPGTSKVVTFSVDVNSLPPEPYEFTNKSTADYTYVDSTGTTQAETSESNTIIINASDVKLTLLKVGPTQAAHGATITYTVIVKNAGNVTTNNIIFKDTPTGASYNANSFAVNGIAIPGANPESASGVNIGSLAPSESVMVSFTATVTAAAPGPVTNKATTTYKYIISPCTPEQTGTNESNEVSTTVS